MEMLEGSRSAPLGRGSRNAEEFEPLVVGDSESNGSAGYRSLEFQKLLVGNGLPNAEKVVPACHGPDDKRPLLQCRGLPDAEEISKDRCAPRGHWWRTLWVG